MEKRKLKQILFERRLILTEALVRGYKLHEIVPSLSLRFGCSRATIYKDYERMEKWVGFFVDNNIEVNLLRERLEVLWRKTVETVLDDSASPELKLAAMNAAIKIVKKQIKLGLALGLIKPKSKQPKKRRCKKGNFNPLILQAITKKTSRQSYRRTSSGMDNCKDANTGSYKI
jgi:hypothetical protein